MVTQMPEVFAPAAVDEYAVEDTVDSEVYEGDSNSVSITVDWLVGEIAARLRENRDYVVVIDGPKGEGKSTLAYHLAERLDKAFSFERNYVFRYSYKEIEGKIYGLPRFAPIVIDEGLKVFYKLDWTSSIQNSLIKLFSTARKHNKVVILCLPYFSELRTSFRQNLVNMWVHVVTRGEGVLFMPDQNPFVTDKWAFAENDKIFRSKAQKMRVSRKEKKYFVFRKLGVYRGEFFFKPMPADKEKSYLDLVQLAEDEESAGGNNENARVTRYRGFWGDLAAWVYLEKLATLTKIAEVSKAPYSTLNDLLREKKVRHIDKPAAPGPEAPRDLRFSDEKPIPEKPTEVLAQNG